MHPGLDCGCRQSLLQGDLISCGFPFHLAKHKFIQYFILEFQLLLSLAVQYPKAIKFLRAIQHWSSCIDFLEALYVKEHTQQAYMWTENQSWIKDDFWNFKFIPIEFCQLTGSQGARRIKNTYKAFFPRNLFIKSGFKKMNSRGGPPSGSQIRVSAMS